MLYFDLSHGRNLQNGCFYEM
uniref:Uncharacterized protein n=1 Tax=Anguilla anguilla TaxID=7936 RepID=A0A0E9XHP6_ANGAN